MKKKKYYGQLDDHEALSLQLSKQPKEKTLVHRPTPDKEHQRIVKRVMNFIDYHFDKNKFEILPEVELSYPGTPASDLVVFDKKSGKTLIFIEVVNDEDAQVLQENVPKLLTEYEIQECFLYLMEKQQFIVFKKTMLEAQQGSFSEILQLDLSKFS